MAIDQKQFDIAQKELKKLFYWRQADLLWMVNLPQGRKLVGVDSQIEERITRVFPNGYSFLTKRGTYISHFFTWERVASKILPILDTLDILHAEKKIENIQEAFIYYASHKEISHTYPLILHTIDTFTANGGGQGRVGGSNATYSTIHDAASGTATNDVTRPSNFFTGSGYEVQRAFAPFDTSSIPDTDTIVSGANTFIRCLVTGKDDNDSDSISVVQSTQASNTSLTGTDYAAVGTTKFATDKTIASITTAGSPGSANDFQLNANGIANISTIGYSKFAWRTAKDIANTAPTIGNNNIQMVDNTNLLSVEHITSTTTSTSTSTTSTSSSTSTSTTSTSTSKTTSTSTSTSTTRTTTSTSTTSTSTSITSTSTSTSTSSSSSSSTTITLPYHFSLDDQESSLGFSIDHGDN